MVKWLRLGYYKLTRLEEKNKIRSFKDLIVFQNTYQAMLVVMKELIPSLPESEKFDLKSQLSRSCKAIPRLIAEGYAKRHQKAGSKKYIDDAMGECNEMLVSIEQVKDIYSIKVDLCNELINTYDITGRQLYKQGESWQNFKSKSNNGSTVILMANNYFMAILISLFIMIKCYNA